MEDTYTNKYPFHQLNSLIQHAKMTLSESDIIELKYNMIKLNIILSIFINFLKNKDIFQKKKFLGEIISNIYSICGENITPHICYQIITNMIKNKPHIQMICLNENDCRYIQKYDSNWVINIIPFSSQVGGSLFFDIISGKDTSNTVRILDFFQLLLDIVAIVPGVGQISELINMISYLLRKDWVNALISLFAIIPIIGVIIGVPVRYVRKYLKWKKQTNDLTIKYKKIDSNHK